MADGRAIDGPAAGAEMQRPMLSAAFVRDHQRRRVIVPVAELAHESSVEEITVTELCRRARIGRTNLYSLFESRESCLEYAFAAAFEMIFGVIATVDLGRDEPWLAHLDSGVAAFFAAIAAEPLLAELCLVHAGSATSSGCDFEAGVEVLLSLMSGGREAARSRGARAPALSPLLEEYLAGSLASLARLRVMQEQAAQLPDHRDEMVLLAASAFFGPEEGARAWRELRQGVRRSA